MSAHNFTNHVMGRKKVDLTFRHRLQFLWLALNPMWKAVTFDVANDEIIHHK